MITRREFIKLAGSLPFLKPSQFVQPPTPPGTGTIPTGVFAFPLTFPVWFPMKSPREKTHKFYLPLMGRNG